MARDAGFIPHTRSSYANKSPGRRIKHKGLEIEELIDDAPLWRLIALLAQQLLGWPMYLLINVSGPPHYPKWAACRALLLLPFDTEPQADLSAYV